MKEIKRIWKTDKEFKVKMQPKERKARRQRWAIAVEKA
jgi:glycerol kinase